MNYDKCSGCTLCQRVCPKNAIKMEPKWFGFLYPKLDESKCIKCGLCDKVCPSNNIHKSNLVDCFIGYTQDTIREKESSGGIFSQLAKYVLGNNGIVFGAVFNKDWDVVITYTDNDITPMLGSKYVQADVKNTYQECQDFLEQGKLVLYTGTPCQIYGLKGFLKHDYDNLIAVDVFCHGAPSPTAWKRYIHSFNKEIEHINFRDKRTAWEKSRITIQFKDGTELSEYITENKYMKLFLLNKILRKSCFECKIRANSKADISLGDAWGIHNSLNDHKGLSDIVIHTEKGKQMIDNLNIIKEKVSYDTILKTNCIDRKLNIPNERDYWLKRLSKKRSIAIVTSQVKRNVGGILQAVALSDKVEELTGIKPHFINQKGNNYHQKFFDNNCIWTDKSITNETDIIVGSDQIWNRRFCGGVPFNDKYLIHKDVNRLVYAASFGHHTMEYTKAELDKIRTSLKDVKYISTREISGIKLVNNWFNSTAISVLDPTMLYDKEYYLNKINSNECSQTHGVFPYILDNNITWKLMLNELSSKLNEPILSFNGSCENFIENFNKAKYIITDSYHGSVFSLIFNKPFICLRNKARGNDRFDDLSIRFDIGNRFIETLNEIKLDLFQNAPNANDKISSLRRDSLMFLDDALKYVQL